MIITLPLNTMLLIAAGGCYAGIQNALAGGGSFITFPTLMLAGLSPLSANISSTLALFPSQITSGMVGRKHVAGVGELSFRDLMLISIVGGLIGGVLLLSTPARFFEKLVPWLVLFATSVFAWGSFRSRSLVVVQGVSKPTLAITQLLISIYGGYFGGGIGFLMLAALTVAGQSVKTAAATKNVLAIAMNASAVALFIFSKEVNWSAVLAQTIGGIAGGIIGGLLISRVPEKALRLFIVIVGSLLTVWLFLRTYL